MRVRFISRQKERKTWLSTDIQDKHTHLRTNADWRLGWDSHRESRGEKWKEKRWTALSGTFLSVSMIEALGDRIASTKPTLHIRTESKQTDWKSLISWFLSEVTFLQVRVQIIQTNSVQDQITKFQMVSAYKKPFLLVLPPTASKVTKLVLSWSFSIPSWRV